MSVAFKSAVDDAVIDELRAITGDADRVLPNLSSRVNRTRVPAPVCVPGSTCTPAARAVSRSPTLATGRVFTMLAASTCAIALPTSTRRCSPVAVVTTGVSVAATARICTSAVAVSPAATVTVVFCSANPTRSTRSSA